MSDRVAEFVIPAGSWMTGNPNPVTLAVFGDGYADCVVFPSAHEQISLPLAEVKRLVKFLNRYVRAEEGAS